MQCLSSGAFVSSANTDPPPPRKIRPIHSMRISQGGACASRERSYWAGTSRAGTRAPTSPCGEQASEQFLASLLPVRHTRCTYGGSYGEVGWRSPWLPVRYHPLCFYARRIVPEHARGIGTLPPWKMPPRMCVARIVRGIGVQSAKTIHIVYANSQSYFFKIYIKRRYHPARA